MNIDIDVGVDVGLNVGIDFVINAGVDVGIECSDTTVMVPVCKILVPDRDWEQLFHGGS